MRKSKQTGGPPRRILARLCALALIAAMLLTGAYAGGAVAPEGVEAAQATESRAVNTVETVSTKERIHINLFDYNGQQANLLYQNTKPANYDWYGFDSSYLNRFTFSGASVSNSNESSSTPWNHWTGQTTQGTAILHGNGVYQGILASKMVGDYPALSDRTIQSYTLRNGLRYVTVEKYNGDPSFSKLFNPANVNQNGAMVKAIAGADKLFQQDSDGYYYYDSRTNFAQINEDTKEFTVYANANDHNNKAPDCPKFLPFNSFNTETGLINESANYHFGMSVDFAFLQPKGGLINEKDMIFTFTGDDDVWLYIDGILVLDMGGIHNPHTGTINFKTGEVTIDNVYTPDQTSSVHPFSKSLYEIMKEAGVDSEYLTKNFVENSDGKRVFKDYTTHTFNYYYLERGAGGSNCEIKFNLPAIPNDTIYVQKEIRNTNIPDFSDAQFKFKVEVKEQDQYGKPIGDYLPYTGEYTVYSGQMGQGTIVRTGSTDDGTFYLQHGQYAELSGIPIKATTQYRVTEIGVYTDQYEVQSNTTVSEIKDSQGNVIGYGAKDLIVNQEPFVTFFNDLMVANAHSLDITKKMANEQTSDQEFQVQIKLGGKVYAHQSYIDITDSNKTYTTDANGYARIKPGHTIRIMQIPWGSSFEVSEILSQEEKQIYASPAYSVTGAETSSSQGDGVAGTIPLKATAGGSETTVTITNTLNVASFTIQKVDEKDPAKLLEGATFDLVKADGSWKPIDQENPVATKITGVDGKATFNDIPFGNYLLYETKAPAGYKLPKDPVQVTVEAGMVTLMNVSGETIGRVALPTEGESTSQPDVTIPNKENDKLPVAGGAGTLWFTGGGLALTGAAALLYFKQRRNKEEE